MTAKKTLRVIWHLATESVAAWRDDYAPSMGAALAYYTFFSLAPLLLIVVSIAGLVFGVDAARGHLVAELAGLVGPEAARSLESLIAHVNQPGKGVLATVVGAVTVLIGATTVFGELQDALDRIWQAPARERSQGLMALLRTRLMSFGMILAIGFLLVVSLVVSAAITALGQWWSVGFGSWQVLARVVNVVVGFGITTLLFATVYKLMPRAPVAWRDVWIGAAVTSLLFTIGRFLIGLYIGRSSLSSAYGAAGSLVIVLVWVYYSAQVFLLGAEFTWVFARRFGSRRREATADARADTAAALAATGAPASGAIGAMPQRGGDGMPAVDTASLSPAHAADAPVASPAARPRRVASNLPWLLAGAVAGAAWLAGRWLDARDRRGRLQLP